MDDRLRAGTLVQIVFTVAHKQQYPNYCAIWEGRTGLVIESEPSVRNRGYSRVLIGGHTLCIEREHVRRWRDLKIRIA